MNFELKAVGRLVMSALACVLATSALAEQQQVAASGSWRAIIATENGQRTCFVIASPTARIPAALKRDPGYLFVTMLADGKETQISSKLGYPLAAVGHVLTVDGRSFEPMSRGDMIWLRSPADEPVVLAAMRAGRTLQVAVRSGRGNITTDTYGLGGFSAAFDELRRRCGS